MSVSNKSNSLIILLLLTIALVIVVVSFFNAKFNFNKEAVGTGIVKMTIAGQYSTSLNVGDVLSFNVNLTSTQAKQARVAGADLSFDPNVFTVVSVTCGTDFPSTAKATSSGNKIYLSCFRPGGAAYTFTSGQASILGVARLQVKPNASNGTTNIAFSRTKIPDAGAGTSVDISDGGTGISVNITGGGGQCPLKGSGDADCNQIIDVNDFLAWRDEFLSKNGLLSDFDQNGKVDVYDFLAWRIGFLNSFEH